MNARENPVTAAAMAALQATNLVNVWSPWSESATFEQDDVDKYVEITHDLNPIHRPTTDGDAVLPGMLSLAALPRYLASRPAVEIDGYRLVFKKINAEFFDIIFVGDEVMMQYSVQDLSPHAIGAEFECCFNIKTKRQVHPSVSVIGRATLLLVQEQMLARMLKVARHRRTKT